MNETFVTTIRKPEGSFAIMIRERYLFRFRIHSRQRDNNPGWEELSNFFEFVEVPVVESRSRPEDVEWRAKFKHLPQVFQIYLLPHLCNTSLEHIKQHLRHFWGLDLNNKRSLLAGISRMASMGHPERTLAWCDVLQYQQPSKRSVFVTLLLKSGVFESLDGEIHASLWREMVPIEGKKNYPLRLWVLLDAIKRRIEPQYIRSGLNLIPPTEVMLPIHRCYDFPVKVIRRLDAHVQKAKDYCRSFAYELWHGCGRLKGLAPILRALNNPQELSADECLQYLDIFCDLATSNQNEDTRSTWEIMRRHALCLWKEFIAMPCDRRMKWIENIRAILLYYPSSRQTMLSEARYLLQRLSSETRFLQIPEFFGSSASDLLKKAGRHKKALLNAPSGSWFKLSQAFQDASGNVEEGLERMMNVIPHFTCKAFHHFPNKLFKIAERLAVLPDGMDKRALIEFAQQPICADRFGKKSDEEIIKYFEAITDFTNPVPTQFQEYGTQPGALSRQRRKRYRKIFHQNLHLTRLEVLDWCITKNLREWQTPLDITNQNILHSVLSVSGKGCNKRAARKFLKAYSRGDEKYVLEHPRTAKWVSKQQSLNLPLWIEGLDLEFDTKEFGLIRIRVEKDPFEAWKLGTYVRSCLSVGRFNSHYASAAVLDINKRVVYARNARNEVIARQLLVLSEEGTLVCFAVYPVKICTEIKKIFRIYDRRFSEALEIPPHEPGTPYTIATILAQGWYDDSPWNYHHESRNP